MAYRGIKFGGDFESWLDDKLTTIRTEASDKLQRVRGLVTLEDSKLSACNGNSGSYGALEEYQQIPANFEGDTLPEDTNGEVEFGELVGDDDLYNGADKLASSLEKYDLNQDKFEVEEDWSWDDLTTERMSRSKQNGQSGGEVGFNAGGAFYTTVFMDDDAIPAEDYPQTPSARDRVAKILRETELRDTESTQSRTRTTQQYDFDYDDSYKHSKGKVSLNMLTWAFLWHTISGGLLVQALIQWSVCLPSPLQKIVYGSVDAIHRP